ncbi:MAG: DUF29 domain-containing protein, partial [Deltaproteobacteria bacterium]|nr:DUF29 domain-containing protein [Deltaproteobacteria bacterium]
MAEHKTITLARHEAPVGTDLGSAKPILIEQMQHGPMVNLVDDFHGWLLDQTSALRERRHFSLDWDNLADELEAITADQRRQIRTQLTKLLLHLLKLKTQPDEVHLHGSWRASIREARNDIEDILEIAPGVFQGKTEEVLAKCYKRARAQASDATGLYIDAFDADCPWSFDQIIDPDFFPA